jgi:hypothetical protein
VQCSIAQAKLRCACDREKLKIFERGGVGPWAAGHSLRRDCKQFLFFFIIVSTSLSFTINLCKTPSTVPKKKQNNIKLTG